ncbi:MAG TPA: phage tail protein [Longimicrobiaceae bacterium]|jgi:phage tail-like protein|nr:phage tail protein [Longimicrobiaceae bacterium]
MAVGDRKDPYRAYNFLVEIDGIVRAGFREAGGLDTTQDPIQYREGTDTLTQRKLPGLVTYSNISLKWGMTDDMEFWDWRAKAAAGKAERKNGSIVLMNDAGEEKLRWNFINGWPTKWSGPALNATGNDVALESVEIAHEGLSKA